MPTIVTGKYQVVASDVAGATAARVTTGLTHIKALQIVEPISGLGDQGSNAYTTDEMQGVEPGMFLMLGIAKASGLIFADGGVFIASHASLIRKGATYFWEARGD
jgi:hypothetical protein